MSFGVGKPKAKGQHDAFSAVRFAVEPLPLPLTGFHSLSSLRSVQRFEITTQPGQDRKEGQGAVLY